MFGDFLVTWGSFPIIQFMMKVQGTGTFWGRLWTDFFPNKIAIIIYILHPYVYKSWVPQPFLVFLLPRSWAWVVSVCFIVSLKSERIDINMYIEIGGILIRRLNEMSISESKSHNHSYWKSIHQVDGLLEGVQAVYNRHGLPRVCTSQSLFRPIPFF